MNERKGKLNAEIEVDYEMNKCPKVANVPKMASKQFVVACITSVRSQH